MWGNILLSWSIQTEFTVSNIKAAYMEINTSITIGYYCWINSKYNIFQYNVYFFSLIQI